MALADNWFEITILNVGLWLVKILTRNKIIKKNITVIKPVA